MAEDDSFGKVEQESLLCWGIFSIPISLSILNTRAILHEAPIDSTGDMQMDNNISHRSHYELLVKRRTETSQRFAEISPNCRLNKHKSCVIERGKKFRHSSVAPVTMIIIPRVLSTDV
ncbi:predicted protein [Histoplasma capsulatum G186AR]|uniref:Uncharacterized protein n=1 Tax=Ajellomyces capsulatus (strain G186AR / H82 / ATCC MYA-2454 / RMSCC 2432) TaxID=447093 RepID=C0NP34_AJECG|nr:uncharacterized protein HCBG_04914 [Histoplasma capsulatum G186AR]EEH06694.1 predicted protein [Histoplasma capsulatum G186AR]